MSATDFSIDDVLFRRTADDECSIVVFGENVGTLVRVHDNDRPGDPWYYIIRLLGDTAGPRQVDKRSQIRLAAADMLWDRGLVPGLPAPPDPGAAMPAAA
ncbi:MAG: hypothetical protein OXI64_05985 [Defluviicoccus sp.]|nr:hypothetical protein [Defluviicoccus sp.]